MNTVSLLNLGFWAQIGTILDIFPKIIYFLYACLSSAVDALQALIRKLAGLDVYYVNNTPVSNRDPLTEFIYGILGFGESSDLYSALNTVFWSLAIFGLIVLAVTTMIAIIKSHYSEDAAQTAPYKYLYTAAKAIFTFAIMPVVVIIGLQLASFVLRTLDNITAGSGGEGEIQTMFGRTAVNRFQGETMANDVIVYGHYDFFGTGEPTNTSSFSGMLFEASAYSSNRARSGSYSVRQLQNMFTAGGSQIFGASDSDMPDDPAEQLEYIADQVDYLFSNNIYLTSAYSYSQLIDETDDVAPVASWTDLFYGIGGGQVKSFSKYNVSLVWLFYNLWSFNYIVAFVGVFVVFGIMLSIIMGLFTRLIKGAALFLVYPAVLGIAPLDDFKAFKGVMGDFMKQLMMAFGSIVGINLLLLIVPIVQTISFFPANVEVVNVIIRLLMLITGLLMAKDFIGMVNGFVGGADASQAGADAKGSIGGKLKAGLKPAGALAGIGVRAAGKGAKFIGKSAWNAGKGIKNSIALKTSASRANSRVKRAKKNEEKRKYASIEKNTLENIATKGHEAELDKIRSDAFQAAKNKGWDDENANRMADEARQDQVEKLTKQLVGRRYYNRRKAKVKKQEARYNKNTARAEEIKANNGLKGDFVTGYQMGNETRQKIKDTGFGSVGKTIGKDFLKTAGDIGLTMADGFLKALKGVGSLLLGDKAIGGAKEIMGESLTYKGGLIETARKAYKEKVTDVKAASEKEAAAKHVEENRQSAMKDMNASLGDLQSTMKELLKTTQDANRAQTDALNNLRKTFKASSPPAGTSGAGSSGPDSGSDDRSTSRS